MLNVFAFMRKYTETRMRQCEQPKNALFCILTTAHFTIDCANLPGMFMCMAGGVLIAGDVYQEDLLSIRVRQS